MHSGISAVCKVTFKRILKSSCRATVRWQLKRSVYPSCAESYVYNHLYQTGYASLHPLPVARHAAAVLVLVLWCHRFPSYLTVSPRPASSRTKSSCGHVTWTRGAVHERTAARRMVGTVQCQSCDHGVACDGDDGGERWIHVLQDARHVRADVRASVGIRACIPRTAVHGFERVVPQRDVVHPQAAFQESWDNVVPDVCGGVSRVTWHVLPTRARRHCHQQSADT